MFLTCIYNSWVGFVRVFTTAGDLVTSVIFLYTSQYRVLYRGISQYVFDRIVAFL